MKKVNSLFTVLVCLSLLTSCATKGQVRKDIIGPEQALIEQDILIDGERFITDSQTRSEAMAKLGPVVEQHILDLQTREHEQIDKEEPKDHVSITDNVDVFNIDMNIENADIRTFARMLSKVTGVNVLVSDEVQGLVTARLQDVPWPNALDSVLSIKALAKHVDNKSKIIRIHSQAAVVQLEDFERNRREALQRTIMLERASEPVYTQIFKLFYTKPKALKDILLSVLGIAKEGGASASGVRNTDAQITVDERMNQLIVKARKDDMQIINTIVGKLDSRTKQVLIEAFIVEVTDDFARAFGTRFGANVSINHAMGSNKGTTNITGLEGMDAASPDAIANLSELPIAGPFGGIGIVTGFGSTADLRAELTAMENEGLSKVISNPRVFTLDNQEAIIFQGDEIPYETVSESGTEIQFKEAGLKLTVTPTVVGDGNLVMNILVNKDTADTSQANPPITKSEIKTSLVSKDNSIVVIGGIYTETETGSIDKVPLVGDIPVLGKAFQRQEKGNNRKELMIFIAPRVL